jgi:proline iminopeptidase
VTAKDLGAGTDPPVLLTVAVAGGAGVLRRGRQHRIATTSEAGYIDVPGGRVWFRSIGNGDGVPLLCLHGGPGFPHDYLEELEGLADRRRVVFYDQLGCGKSDRPGDTSLWQVDRFVEELAVVREALGLERLHLFGSSWGGMLALQYVLDRRPPLMSLVLSSSPASCRRWTEDCTELLAAFPETVRDTIRRHEAHRFTGCLEYSAAILPYYKRHVCRLDPWPDGLERSFAGVNQQIYEYMAGPSEFAIVGTLRDWDVSDRLGEIDVPTLITCGEHDELRPAHAKEMQRRIANAELEVFPGASHVTMAEVPEAYRERLNEFFDRVELSSRT